jgi:cytochrome c5
MKLRWILFLTTLAFISTLALAACSGAKEEALVSPDTSSTGASSASGGAAALDGQALVEDRCTACHDLTRVKAAKKTSAEWKVTVERMVGHGAQLDNAEQETVIQYLAEAYPK